PGSLELRVLVEGMERFVAAGAGLLEAPERHGDVVRVVAVDVDDAGAQRTRHAMRAADIARPHGGGEPVNPRVADRDRLGRILDADRGKNRPADLLARDL